MKTLTLKTAKELKTIVESNRENITNINGVAFGPLYPMLEVSNKHAMYYDVNTQTDEFLRSPFIVTTVCDLEDEKHINFMEKYAVISGSDTGAKRLTLKVYEKELIVWGMDKPTEDLIQQMELITAISTDFDSVMTHLKLNGYDVDSI